LENTVILSVLVKDDTLKSNASEGYFALAVSGDQRRYDFGIPDDYLASLAAFRNA
jgi:hypothetical protein